MHPVLREEAVEVDFVFPILDTRACDLPTFYHSGFAWDGPWSMVTSGDRTPYHSTSYVNEWTALNS
jgi:hypothetical protein